MATLEPAPIVIPEESVITKLPPVYLLCCLVAVNDIDTVIGAPSLMESGSVPEPTNGPEIVAEAIGTPVVLDPNTIAANIPIKANDRNLCRFVFVII